ncbi:MAG: hypothetical protein HY735_15105, partial [Verrucomicrobia bacterium]|nr:hypothetical protein [Verrucomicrobiota bacterium]
MTTHGSAAARGGDGAGAPSLPPKCASIKRSCEIFILRTALLCCLLWLGGWASRAEVPALFSVQGRLLMGTTVVDGPADFKFALVNANGSQTYWR